MTGTRAAKVELNGPTLDGTPRHSGPLDTGGRGGARLDHADGAHRPVVVVGQGLIGGMIAARLAGKGVPVITVARSRGTLRCDLTDAADRALMLEAVRATAPRSVVLVHGPSDVTWCEAEPDAAMATHHGIAEATAGIGCPVVLVSTDNVFDGTRPHNATTDPVCPQNGYGRAKLAAERAVLAQAGNVVLRVSLVYGWSDGEHRANYAERCLHAAMADEPTSAPIDQEFTPVHVDDVATVVTAVAMAPDTAPPLAHVAGPDHLSRAAFAELAYRAVGASPSLVTGVPRAQTTWASRPANSSLACSDLSGVAGLGAYRPMTAKAGLTAMAAQKPPGAASTAREPGVAPGQAWFGVDAGGTRTQVVLVCQHPDGSTSRHAASFLSLNPAAATPGEAAAALRAVLGFVREHADDLPVRGWFGSASMSRWSAGQQLGAISAAAEEIGLRGRVELSNDVLPLLLAPPLSGSGGVIVAGTGSAVFAGDGVRVVSSGGHEYLGSDEGSGFDIGLAGLRAACRALDGVAAPTTLAEALAAHLGADPRDAARALAQRPFPKQAVAALAPVVCACWLNDDEVSGRIIGAAITHLSDAAAALRGAAGTPPEAGTVLTGGVLVGCPRFAMALSAALTGRCGEHPVTVLPDASGAALLLAEHPPAASIAADRSWHLSLGAAHVLTRREVPA